MRFHSTSFVMCFVFCSWAAGYDIIFWQTQSPKCLDPVTNTYSSCLRYVQGEAYGGPYVTAAVDVVLCTDILDAPLTQGSSSLNGYVITSSPSCALVTCFRIQAKSVFTDNIGNIINEDYVKAIYCDGTGPGDPPCPNEKRTIPEIGYCPPQSPIVVDLDQNRFAFGGPDSGVYFDILGDGSPMHLQWVLPGGDDAFLGIDLDGNGYISDGSELFGSGTRFLSGERTGEPVPNGFVGLAQYDLQENGGNNDGFISGADMVWDSLILWLDENADGVSTAQEIFHVSQVGLTRFEIIPLESRRRDRYGNLYTFRAQAFDDLKQVDFDMVDVYFQHIP